MKKYIFIMATSIVVIFAIVRCQQQDTPIVPPTGKTQENISKQMESLNVPSGFDWSTSTSLKVSVNVDNKYPNYYYIVEIYDNNPIIDPTASLLGKALVKPSETYTANVTIPKGLTTIYISQTSPVGKKMVKEYAANAEAVTASFVETTTKILKSSPTKALPSGVRTSYPTPSNAIVITGKGEDNKPFEMNPREGKAYVIRGTYTGEIKFNGESQGVELYVEGTWINKSKTLHMGNGDKFIVQKGGKVSTDEDVSIGMDNASIILVSEGATFNADDKNISVKASNNQEQLVNLGTLHLNEVDRVKTVYNAGTMTIKTLSFDVRESLVENDKSLTITTGKLTNGTINNNCNILFKEDFKAVQPTINIREGAIIQTPKFDASGVNFNLAQGAMLKVTDEADFTSNTSKIIGTGSGYALVIFEKETSRGWNGVEYSGRVEIECSNHTKNGQYSIAYTLNSASGARVVPKGQSTVAIASTECNNGGNKIDDDDPTPVDYPINVNLGSTYTYSFEDTYPNIDDYDMNDFVADVNISYTTLGTNQMTNMIIKLVLRATGATKHLAAGIQLDGLLSNNISNVRRTGPALTGNVFSLNNGIEAGQTYAVLPITDDVHHSFGLGENKYTFVNTKMEDEKIATQTVTFDITFSKAIDITNINLLNIINLFIINDFPKNANRQEVHLRGYKSTDKSTDISSNGNYTAKGNLVHGIRVVNGFKYPVEWKSILSAYPKFEEWVTSGGTSNLDWKESPNSGNIYTK